MMNVDDSRLRCVLDVFNSVSVAVYEGQRLDMDFETRDEVSVEEYLDMIEKKTSLSSRCFGTHRCNSGRSI